MEHTSVPPRSAHDKGPVDFRVLDALALLSVILLPPVGAIACGMRLRGAGDRGATHRSILVVGVLLGLFMTVTFVLLWATGWEVRTES